MVNVDPEYQVRTSQHRLGHNTAGSGLTGYAPSERPMSCDNWCLHVWMESCGAKLAARFALWCVGRLPVVTGA